MREDVSEHHVEGGGDIVAGQAHRCGPAGSMVQSHERPSSSARAPQKAARSSATSARSLRTAIASCRGRRAERIELAHRRLQPVDTVEELGSAAPLGVESESGERGAEAVGQVGDPLTFGGKELVDAIGQQVEGFGDIHDLRWTGDGRRAARVSPPASARLVRARSAAGRVTLRASRSVAITATPQQDDGYQPEHQP